MATSGFVMQSAPGSANQRGRPCVFPAYGFTLMETLVAVIIVALTVTVFFQLFSASMNLERRGRVVVQEILLAERVFGDLQRQDIREGDFSWSGETDGLSWRLEIHPVEIVDMKIKDDETPLSLPTELFRFEFHYSKDNGPTRTIHRYAAYPPDFFDDQFRARSFADAR